MGIQQQTLEKSLKEEIENIRVGQNGFVFVLNSKGEFLVSRQRSSDTTRGWEAKDGDGHFYVHGMIQKVLNLDDGGIGQHRYLSVVDMTPNIVKLAYFKGWGWIIGVNAPEADFLVVRDKITELGNRSAILSIMAALVFLVLVVLSAVLFARHITRPIMDIIMGLESGAEQTSLSSGQVSEYSTIDEIAF